MPRTTRVDARDTVRADGKRQCGARKRDGSPCTTTVGLGANGRCRMHGGTRVTGLASPNTTTGRYSRDLPTRMLARYGLALDDAELLSLRDDVALLQGMIGDKLAEIQEAEANPDLDAIVGMVETIQGNWRTWDWTRMERELGQLQEAITGRVAQAAALREVRELVREKATLTAQENRRLVELQQTVTVEQAILLAQSLVGIVRQRLGDLPDANDRLRVIAGDFRELMTRREPYGG